IIAAGGCGSPAAICVARYTPAGVLDTNFNATGIRTITPSATSWSRAAAIAIDSKRKIVVAGTCNFGTVSAVFEVMCTHRINVDGSIDTTFGSSGTNMTLTLFNSQESRMVSVAILPNEYIFVAGTCGNENDSKGFCYDRYGPNGAFDPRHTGAIRYFNFEGLSYNNAALTSILVHPEGHVTLAGRCRNFNNPAGACWLTINPDGSLPLKDFLRINFPSSEEIINVLSARAADHRIFFRRDHWLSCAQSTVIQRI
ncbi:MAG: hypothetical protein ACRCWJ_05015, partial [Casimicrobium sp.]